VGLRGAWGVARDVAAALAGDLPGALFDVVVADPAYAIDPGDLAAVLAALGRHLASDAVVTLELGRRVPAPAWPGELLPGQPRRYGDTVLHRATATTPPAVAAPGADPP
jgi:16S rRNA (guanine966-N2)-methyltransferase